MKEHFESHYLSGTIGAHTRVKDQQYKITDHTGPLNGPLSPTISAPLPPLHLTQAEAMELGFLPLRDDFEREWDNDAEQVQLLDSVTGVAITFLNLMRAFYS